MKKTISVILCWWPAAARTRTRDWGRWRLRMSSEEKTNPCRSPLDSALPTICRYRPEMDCEPHSRALGVNEDHGTDGECAAARLRQ